MAVKRPQLPMRQPPQRPVANALRLSDKLRDAFHAACDEGAVEIAERLLNQLGELIHRPSTLPTGIDRRRPESIAALCERLANLLLWCTESARVQPRSRSRD
jgi:hypothetical protein